MHAITILPCVSCSSRNCLTAHCRHAPTEPIAGCQQKYGRSKPSEGRRAACSAPASTAIGAAVDVDRALMRSDLQGQRCSRMCRSKSSRKYFSALCSGSTAPGASAQNVWPGPSRRDCCASSSRSDSWPLPSSIAASVRATHGSPSRHGVHQPHDSRAKNCSRLSTMPDRAGLVVEDDHRAGAHAAAGFLHRRRSPSSRRGAPRRGNRWMRRRGCTPRKPEAVAHAAGVLFEDLADAWCPSAAPTRPDASPGRSRRRAWCRPRRCGSAPCTSRRRAR